MTYDEIITDVSVKLGLPKGEVNKIYRAYWRAAMEHIASLPLKEDLTDEMFLKLQPNVNIPSIGKLYVTLDRYKRMKYINQKLAQEKDVAYNENQTIV